MARAHTALQRFGDFFYSYPGLVAWWVKNFGGGQPDQVHAGGFEQRQVTLFVARVSFEIFARSKLRGIDKDAGDHTGARLAGGFDKRKVTGVQVSHRGHKTNRFGQRSPVCVQFR